MAGVVLTRLVRVALGLLPAVITGIVLAYFITSGSWQFFGIWTEPSVIGWTTGFADLANQSATADCIRNGTDITTCDPYGRPFQPYAVIPASVFAALGLGVAATGMIGILLAGTYTLVIAGLGLAISFTWRRPAGSLITVLAALTLTAVSPPALLIVERGQIEILILGFATVGLAAFVSHRAIPRAFGTVALISSVILKYFNLGVFLAFLAPRRWNWWAAAGIATSVAFLLLNLSDVQTATSTAGSDKPSTSRVMFGSTTLLVTLAVEDPAAFNAPEGQVLPMALYRVLGIAFLLLLIAAWFVILYRFRKGASLPDISWFWVVGSTGAVLLPYALGGSNDYRLVLLLPLIAGTALWLGRGGSVPILSTVLALMVVVMWTNAWMIPNPAGWEMPRVAIIAGEIALSAVLAFGVAVFLTAWLPYRKVQVP